MASKQFKVAKLSLCNYNSFRADDELTGRFAFNLTRGQRHFNTFSSH